MKNLLHVARLVTMKDTEIAPSRRLPWQVRRADFPPVLEPHPPKNPTFEVGALGASTGLRSQD